MLKKVPEPVSRSESSDFPIGTNLSLKLSLSTLFSVFLFYKGYGKA